jgi:tetratricopeptide (TPR) repeat protein
VKLSKSKLKNDHPITLTSNTLLGMAYLAGGRLDDAITVHEEALQGFRAKLSPDHPQTLTAERRLAESYTAAGKFAKAEPFLRDAVERATTQFGSHDPRTAGPLASLGANLVQLQKWSEAEPFLRACLTIREVSHPDDWSTFNTRSLLGASLLGQRKFDEAEPLIVSGYEGLKARESKLPAHAITNLASAGERVIQLYEARGEREKADEWRLKLPPTTPTDIPKNADP